MEYIEEATYLTEEQWQALRRRLQSAPINLSGRSTLIQTELHPASEQESVLVSETDIVPVCEFRGRYGSTGA